MRLRRKTPKVYQGQFGSDLIFNVTDEQRVRRLLYGPFSRKGEVKRVGFNDLLWLDWAGISWERYPLPVPSLLARMAGMLYFTSGRVDRNKIEYNFPAVSLNADDTIQYKFKFDLR